MITLIGENYSGQPPSQAELMQWASDYGISHPVVSDPGFAETAQYLYADPNYNGMFYLPNMQLLSPGMVVEISNGWISQNDFMGFL